MASNNEVSKLIHALEQRSVDYFRNDMGLDVLDKESRSANVKELSLRHLTTLVGIGGNLCLYVVFSYDESMIRRLFEIYTKGMQIKESDVQLYIEVTASDMINTVVGNVLGEVARPDEVISMTPPMLLTQAQNVFLQQDTYFYKTDIRTEAGVASVMCIGREDLFDNTLNCVENQ